MYKPSACNVKLILFLLYKNVQGVYIQYVKMGLNVVPSFCRHCLFMYILIIILHNIFCHLHVKDKI